MNDILLTIFIIICFLVLAVVFAMKLMDELLHPKCRRCGRQMSPHGWDDEMQCKYCPDFPHEVKV